MVWGRLCVDRFALVFLALYLGGCGLPRGHREGYVELGFDNRYVASLEEGCLADRLGVEAPITTQVRLVLDGEKTPQEAGHTLMTRQLRSERDSTFKRASRRAASPSIKP